VRLRLLCLSLVLVACLGRPDPDATGQEIYEQSCSGCHGVDLSGRVGQPSLGASSDAAGQPDEALILTVTRGKGRMPSFEESLTAEQVLRVVAYVREKQRG
jgi:mono/diheme cytochrome c family protein